MISYRSQIFTELLHGMQQSNPGKSHGTNRLLLQTKLIILNIQPKRNKYHVSWIWLWINRHMIWEEGSILWPINSWPLPGWYCIHWVMKGSSVTTGYHSVTGSNNFISHVFTSDDYLTMLLMTIISPCIHEDYRSKVHFHVRVPISQVWLILCQPSFELLVFFLEYLKLCFIFVIFTFKESGSHCNLIFLNATGISRPLGSDIILPATSPILVIFRLFGYKYLNSERAILHNVS